MTTVLWRQDYYLYILQQGIRLLHTIQIITINTIGKILSAHCVALLTKAISSNLPIKLFFFLSWNLITNFYNEILQEID